MKKSKYLNNTFISFYSLIQKLGLKRIKELMYYIDRVICLFIKKPKAIDGGKKNVLIIFNLALGDGVVFLNAINNIRELYPDNKYNIDILCQKGLELIYNDLGIFDNVIPLNFTKATVNLKERYRVIKKIRKKYYDVILDPVGANECFTNVLLTRNSCGDKKYGCIIESYEQRCSKHILKRTYNEIKILKSKSLIEQYYEFFYKDYNIEYCKLPMSSNKLNLPKKYYIVFPSASMELKKWPIDRYAKIVTRIYNKTKLPLVFCGTNVDRDTFKKLEELIPNIPVIDVIGKTSLIEFIDVINNASFVITNDTSTYHIAVISETPVAIVTGGYTYDRYVTYEFKGCNKYKKPYVIVDKMDCFNCINNCKKINKEDKTWPCLNNITVDYAWKIIEEMIDKEL